jgi:hypothetical protein
MSFWSSLFGGNAQERDVEAQIVQDLIDGGMPTADAVSVVRSCIDAAKEEIRKEGTQRLPPNYGDVLLQHEKTDPNVAKELAKKRREGVTDEDIRVYWNASELWRRTVDQLGWSLVYSLWKELVNEGRSDKEAAAHVRKYFPYWGDPDDARVTSGDDRPLPVELSRREDAWTSRERERIGDQTFKERCESSSSYNAIIRAEIRAGRFQRAVSSDCE